MDAAFDIGEELERKTLDVLSRIVTDFEQGAISQPSAQLALRSVFDSTAGLLGNEVFDLISQASAHVNSKAQPNRECRIFINAERSEVVMLTYQYGEAVIGLKRGKLNGQQGSHFTWEHSSQTTFETEVNPFEVARQRYDGYARSLIRHAFIEIG